MRIKLIVIILVIVAGAGYYIWHDLKEDNLETEFPSVSTSQMPSLDREINITANIADETKELAKSKIEEVRGNLRENADLRSSWLDLASYYKLIGDFEGAREVWEYMISKDDSDYVPCYNLGNLYGYYLKDFGKAEEYYNKAIEKNPNYIASYATFYDFYIDYEKPDLAEGVLIQGLEANPDNPELTQLLELHRKN